MRPLTDNDSLLNGVAIFGIVATQIMNLSSIPSISDIVRLKSTLLYPSFPFSISIISSGTSIVYAFWTDQRIVGISSIMTVAQSSAYLGVHLYFSRHQSRIVREFVVLVFLIATAMAAGLFVGCVILDQCLEFTIQWFGVVMAIVSCFRYGAQAITFRQVVSSRNAASISPAMTAGALFGSLAWSAYSILAGDPYYLASGLAGTLSCLVQVLLLAKYPRRRDDASDVYNAKPVVAPRFYSRDEISRFYSRDE